MDLQKKKKNSHFLKNSQPRGGEGGSGEVGMVSQLLPVLNYDSFPKNIIKNMAEFFLCGKIIFAKHYKQNSHQIKMKHPLNLSLLPKIQYVFGNTLSAVFRVSMTNVVGQGLISILLSEPYGTTNIFYQETEL